MTSKANLRRCASIGAILAAAFTYANAGDWPFDKPNTRDCGLGATYTGCVISR